MFYHDSTGYVEDHKEKKEFKLLPAGKWFPFQIVDAKEKVTKNGDDMLELICEVTNTPEYNGTRVWHYVTFFKDKKAKAFSMSIHFRKVIGQPYGNNDLIDHLQWIGAKFMGQIKHEEYNGKPSHKLKAVNAIDDGKKDEEIPF